MNTISYLERNQIDEIKWDTCIQNAQNENIYGYAAYLDKMANHWDALVINDYQAVLPLPWKKKLGFAYIYTPRFTSPLAIYGQIPESMKLHEILDHIPKKFRLWDINLVNNLSQYSSSAIKRKNHLLHLFSPYEELKKNYRKSYLNLLKQTNNQISRETSIDDIIDMASQKNINGTNADDYVRFQNLYCRFAKKGNAFSYGIYSDNNTLMAAAVFFISANRIYYMLAANNEEGRKNSASHQLIDAVIREYAGKNYWLDFEGSDIPGIAFFFEGFGAQPEEYYYLSVNRLPWWCAWVKKSW